MYPQCGVKTRVLLWTSPKRLVFAESLGYKHLEAPGFTSPEACENILTSNSVSTPVESLWGLVDAGLSSVM